MGFNFILCVGVLPFILQLVQCQLQFGSSLSTLCPQLSNKVWIGYAPKGNKEAGTYTVAKKITDLKTCVTDCCRDIHCNVIFMYNTTCYKIECYSNDLCEPVERLEPKFGNNVRMVSVRPIQITPSFNWELPDINNSDDLAMAGSEVENVKTCELNEDCSINEICQISFGEPGVCKCRAGYKRNSDNLCEPINGNSSGSQLITNLRPNNYFSTQASLPSFRPKTFNVGRGDVSSPSPPKKILVEVISKQIRLPDNEVELIASTIPADISEKKRYSYKWTPLSQPEGSSGTVSENQGGTLKLSHLTEGLYTFKVTVSAPGEFGETEANVTVLPQKRENKPPQAIVLPSHQIVKLPNSLAVLDASSSKDDAGITKFHWELQQGPLGYQPNLSDSQTLQLKDLKKPGNYSFRMTVTDTDGATNSTVANITVSQVPDYPPEANAGSSIVLYLPRNNVTLNGNLSSDDKGIVSWEWTKSPSDSDKAVDMQNTHTPYVQLSHLEEGMYTFVLKVTDDSGQSSSSDVHVFVKPPTNKPPSANAGSNITIALPQTYILLNGSQSSDDISIDKWDWECVSGPRKVVFLNSNTSVANATGLTKGEYLFKLTVTDGDENSASDTVAVTVTQNKNQRPKANAGGDQTLTLPVGVLIVNGSLSTDDLGISRWQWTRELTSLAMGTIIDHSDTSPVLMVTNVVAGKYEFRLRVTDDQGEWDEDKVSIILKQDSELLNLVELTLNIDVGKLTQAQRDSVLLKLGMLLRDASQLVVRDLRSDNSGRAKLVFYVTSPSGSVPGPQVVTTLKHKLAQDSFLLQMSVVDIRTTVCQNNCSGHGVCDQETRVCYCESFWMPDLFKKYMGDGDSNCGWSILYVTIALLSLTVIVGSAIWGLVCLFSRLCRWRHTSNDKTKYALLESTEQIRPDERKRKRFRKKSRANHAQSQVPMDKVILSDSDTDSDVLFENRHGKTNGTKSSRNGYKSDRRIKT
ncbi:dyslexia-associated protein KIAA0319-like protein isoform X1 [Rhodnius prolixus]|uniref:dyslexia-associated protein KIAA0319-like protein isoform X1 n=1 Tax=Rhodnius prolixus TaxID=13249 RepID=UPI003D18C423